MDQMTRHSPAKIHLAHATPQESLNPMRECEVQRSGCDGHRPVHPHWIRDTKTTREALLYDEQLQCEVPPKSKYSSSFLV
jgi:hypothetical protein